MLSQQEATTPQDGQSIRSSSKTAAIRRGDLKISAPILLPNGDGKSTAKTQTELMHMVPNGATVPDSLSYEERPHERSTLDKSGVQDNVVDEQPHLRHKPSTLRDWSMTQARERPLPGNTTVPANNAGPFESFSGSNGTMQARKKQKGGSLRAVFRKVFGRKPRTEVTHHSYHRSDPIILPTTISRTQDEDGDEKRLARQRVFSMPLQEITPKTSLHSHLPFPMNVNAPELIDPPHDYLSFESSPHVHRRRATLPSTVVNSVDVAALSALWNDEGPISKEQDPGQTSEREIGLAITSPNREQRRSRSAGALQETARQQGQEGLMRRSAEVHYWRPSYDAGPQSVRTSSETKVQATPKDTEDTSRAQTAEPSTDETLATEAGVGEALDISNAERQDHPNESMTQPIPATDARVSRTEDNMQCLEYPIHDITGRSHQQTIVLSDAPKTLRSRQRSRSPPPDVPHYPTNLSSSATDPPRSPRTSRSTTPSSFSSSSSSSSPRTPTHQPTFLASPLSYDFPSPAPTAPSPHPPASPPPAEPPTHQLARLAAALRHERAARKTLEAQVRALRREVRELGVAVKRDGRSRGGGAGTYPTPSPDGVVVVGAEGEGEGEGAVGREREFSRFSGFDSGSEYGDEDEEEGETLERFETPREERGAFGFGFGRGSESGEEEEKEEIF